MELLCTAQSVSKFPNQNRLRLFKPSISLTQASIIRLNRISLPRLRYFRNQLPRSTASEEMSSDANQYLNEKHEGAVILEDALPDDKNAFNGLVETEETKDEISSSDEPSLPFEFFDKLDIKFDLDDTGSVLLYVSGALVIFWLASAVVGAIDSLPLFPKVMEVIGLGYTIWFSYRYLIFKKNRDELASKVKALKEQVLGMED